MITELYKKYRPTKFSQLVGQSEAVQMLSELGKRKAIPHCLLFVGESGCGKTSLARILRRMLKCGDADFTEVNAAESRGIDMVRDIQTRMGLAPLNGECRVWLVDECAKLTSDAQSCFLKILEDTPKHVYFMLATTDPQKLKKTIITRSTVVKLKPLNSKDMMELLSSVVEKELEGGRPASGVNIKESVLDKIIEVADGSARKALVLLHSVLDMDDEEKQLEVIVAGDPSHDAIEIARALLRGASWKEMSGILKGIEGLDDVAESVRWLVLSYMSSVALKNPSAAGGACRIIDAFRDNWFDCKKAGLISACFEVLSAE